MEINDLRYFVAVAKVENINQAGANINISPSALSKSISKLEKELSVKLFERVGRRIVLSSHGKVLQQEATKILALEEDAKIRVGGSSQELLIKIAGEEGVVSKYSCEFIKKMKSYYPSAKFEIILANGEKSKKLIKTREAHFALTTEPKISDFNAKKLDKVKFRTVVGKGHPLYKMKRPINVYDLLEYPFISTKSPILGKVKEGQSYDGWRDDKFQRNIGFHVSSLKTFENLLLSGQGVAYLPDYLIQNLELKVLDVRGCPYFCEQKVSLITSKPIELGWLIQTW